MWSMSFVFSDVSLSCEKVFDNMLFCQMTFCFVKCHCALTLENTVYSNTIATYRGSFVLSKQPFFSLSQWPLDHIEGNIKSSEECRKWKSQMSQMRLCMLTIKTSLQFLFTFKPPIYEVFYLLLLDPNV